MDFRPSAEQLELQEGIASFCRDRCSDAELRRIEEAGGFDAKLFRELAGLGAFQIAASEKEGGLGLGMAEAVLVHEALGQRVVPGPLVFQQLAAGRVEGAASADLVVGGLDLTAPRSGSQLVEYAAQLDVLLLLREDGVHRVNRDALESAVPVTPFDPLTPVSRLDIESAIAGAERIADAEAAHALRLEALCLNAALSLGIAETTLEIALAFAKEREQFGRTIGSFQAIKHMLADMFARQELIRAAVYAAGATLDAPEVGDVGQAVRGAYLLASEGAIKNARACIQIHGGMGYTWEVPDHLFLKRAMVLGTAFGSAEEHTEAIAAHIATIPLEVRYADASA